MGRKDRPTVVYRDFDNSDWDDRPFYASLTPAGRIKIMIALPPEHRETPMDRTPRITHRPQGG